MPKRRVRSILQQIRSWRADTWIAGGAAVISLCALILTLFEAAASREHDRLSVIPYLQLSTWHDTAAAAVIASNGGLGPALIRVLNVTVDGRTVETWSEALDKLGLPGGYVFHYTQPGPGSMIKEGEQGDLLRIEDPKAARALQREFRRLNVVMCYCSLYGECWVSTLFRTAELEKPGDCPKGTKNLHEP